MGLTKRELFTLVAMNGLIRKKEGMYATKKQLVDNAIAYADMALRRLNEIPCDAQQKCEQGKNKWEKQQYEKE